MNDWTPEKIRELRRMYDETQETFRHRVGMSLDGYRGWEQGKAEPAGSAQLLMDRLLEDYQKGEVRELVG